MVSLHFLCQVVFILGLDHTFITFDELCLSTLDHLAARFIVVLLRHEKGDYILELLLTGGVKEHLLTGNLLLRNGPCHSNIFFLRLGRCRSYMFQSVLDCMLLGEGFLPDLSHGTMEGRLLGFCCCDLDDLARLDRHGAQPGGGVGRAHRWHFDQARRDT